MKTIKNIILVLLFVIAVTFCLYIAPNYQPTGYEGKTNLVINFKNVTGKMKGKVIKKNEDIYISISDIQNYYDQYLYLDEKYNYIIAAGNGYIACFDINNNTLNLNGNISQTKVIKEDDLYYIPITSLQKLYNIKVEYKETTDTVSIDSLDRELKQATLNKNTQIKSKTSFFSRTLEKVDENSIVYIKDSEDASEEVKSAEPNGILQKINNLVNENKTRNSENWTYVKTQNGTVGYIYNKTLNNITIARAKENKDIKTVSLAWDYYENVAATPKNDSNTKYKGVNVVSPAFFFLEDDGNIRENIGEPGLNYISWAKENNYEIWPLVKCDNLLTDNMRSMLSDYKQRETVIKQIEQLTKKYNLDGVNIDFENIKQEDKKYFSRFIIELKPRLENIGADLSVDVTPPDGSPNWSLCYDRKTIGDVADYIVFMAYDQTSKKGKKIGSNAAYNWVETNIVKFIKNEEVDPNKIILAIPFYSRLWKINTDGTPASGYDINIKNQDKYLTKATKKEWLTDAKQNCIEYIEQGYTYKMWIEDADSISSKLDLIKKYNLAGAAFWEKGMETDDIFDIVQNKLF